VNAMIHDRPYYTSLHQQIYRAGTELLDPLNDGFLQWEIKQELYRLKWLIDDILKQSSTFAGEQEFLNEHEKAIVWRSLKS